MNKYSTNSLVYTGIVAGLLLIAGCDENMNYDELQAQEERYFYLYMEKNYPDLEATQSGLYVIPFEEGTGAAPDIGDYVLINYLAYTIPDEAIVDTYTEEWARQYGLYSSDVMYGPYKYKHGTEIEGLLEGISMLKEGGMTRLIFMSDLGYGEEEYGKIGQFQSLMYDVQLVEVIDDPIARQKEQINEYIATQTGAQKFTDPETGSEYYYIPVETGDSIQVEDGDRVEVYYTGQLLDGREFDSNEGENSGFKLKVGEETVIKGWDLGLTKFRYGGTGKLVIPSDLAYGEEGKISEATKKTSVPPYEALLFDIEVTKTVVERKDI